MRKIISVLLCAANLLALAACGETESSVVNNETTATQTDETTTEAVREDSLPELDYNGETVTIYAASDLPITEFDAEQTGDIVDDAVYNRNVAVEERLNVQLEYIMTPGLWANENGYKSAVRNSVNSGDAAYDIVAGYGVFISQLAAEQLFCDLTTTQYLDFDKPWWSDSLLDDLAVGGRLYFASGDISTNLIGSAFAVLFNKQLANDYSLGNLYQLVDDGSWTLDKLFSLTKDTYTDLNSNESRDKDDFFGLVVQDTSIDNLYFSSGMNTTQLDSERGVSVSPDFGSEKAATLAELLCDMIHHTDGVFLVTEDSGDGIVNFKSAKSIFLLAGMKVTTTDLRDAEIDYGVLPAPKWDENQTEYLSTTSYLGSLYAIPKGVRDADMSSAVMEALAIEGYYEVSPAFFETALKVKYSSDEDTARMYDIIRGSISYDFGRVFSTSINSIPGMLRGMVVSDNPNWMSNYEKNISVFETKLAEIAENLGGIE